MDLHESLDSNNVDADNDASSPYLINDNSSILDNYMMLKPRILEGDEDTRSELKFDDVNETNEETEKRLKIEDALENENTTLNTWRTLAKEEYGLVNDALRRKIWPILLGVDPDPSEKAPLLSELSTHCEYDQVVLDVKRSLKRFPPGIPYKQRVALQDQLTVLILRVIIKYPHLRYYQGYHDVAITFLLAVGEAVSFRIMERLSTDHLHECMEKTMEKTSYRLSYIYPILQREDKRLYEFLEEATVGTMFALPWYLTWFGHSLNQYRDVVRLYDYFLASDPLLPVYVAASMVIERREEIFNVGCEMANIHCLLTHIPDELNFESILERATQLYKKHPPNKVEYDVKARVKKELYQRKKDELRIRRRLNKNKPVWVKMTHCLPDWLLIHYQNKYGLLFVTATFLVGLYAYLKAAETGYSIFKNGSWPI